ncbi:MAG: anthranilate synthase component I [Alphaproteobacteria bacterium]
MVRPAPDFTVFSDIYQKNQPQLVYATLVYDMDTPVGALKKLEQFCPYRFLFESVEGGVNLGRYSFIVSDPDIIWKSQDGRADIAHLSPWRKPMDWSGKPSFRNNGESLVSLRRLIAETRLDVPTHLPPMATGIFGFMGYDIVQQMEKLPNRHHAAAASMVDKDVPDALFIRPRLVAVFDHVKRDVTIITAIWPDANVSAEQAFACAQERLYHYAKLLDNPLPVGRNGLHDQLVSDGRIIHDEEPLSNTGRKGFEAMVEKAREYILAGDIFQVVLSHRFSMPFKGSAFSLYRSLRRLNPSPFLFNLNFDGFALVGSSPEILVRLRDGEVAIRPLAGTRPRGKNAAEDERIKAELLADPKENAEHLMLLDLGRNDVGRVAKTGTVKVTSKMDVEYYSHVMHIVSHVVGQVRDDVDALDVLQAGFPAGTVSGAPKIRAMEVIDELEVSARGFYAGTVGYFGADGGLDSCITLRTALIKDGWLHVQAGAGVVADSVPAHEYEETCNKALAIIRAAQQAF